MKLSDNGFQLIKHYEGLKLISYPDGDGYSIGYGHHRGVKAGQTITILEANDFLRHDVEEAEEFVSNSFNKIPLLQNQFDALVGHVYNIGSGQASELINYYLIFGINSHYPNLLLSHILNKNGDILPGLVKRRMSEFILFTENKLWLPLV